MGLPTSVLYYTYIYWLITNVNMLHSSLHNNMVKHAHWWYVFNGDTAQMRLSLMCL